MHSGPRMCAHHDLVPKLCDEGDDGASGEHTKYCSEWIARKYCVRSRISGPLLLLRDAVTPYHFSYVYVLESLQRARELYVGYTRDLRRRLREHNEGVVISTRRYMPGKLLYYEAFPNETYARRREKSLKDNGNPMRELKKRIGYTKSDKGFTLIEVMVTVAIIGLLATIVLVSLNGGRGKTRDARRISDIKQIQTALELYLETCTRYPAQLAPITGTSCEHDANIPLPNPPMGRVPTDPGTSANYNYASYYRNGGGAAACTGGYHLGALLQSSNNLVLIHDGQSTTDAATNDIDGPPAYPSATTGVGGICTGSNADFQGTSLGVGGNGMCFTDLGTAATANNLGAATTERCYDIVGGM